MDLVLLILGIVILAVVVIAQSYVVFLVITWLTKLVKAKKR